MIVICLEGCHGSGKTSLLSSLQNEGFNVLDEAFIDMPSYTKALHPQSLMMESMWVCQWFKRLLKRKADVDSKGLQNSIFFADRSPYSAVFYSQGDKGRLLQPVIREQIVELQESADIEVFTVYVKVRKDVLWSRIQARLAREPSRKQFSENDESWMLKTLKFYENNKWDCHIDNSVLGVEKVMINLVSILSRKSRRFCDFVSQNGGTCDSSSNDCKGYSPRVRAASRQCQLICGTLGCADSNSGAYSNDIGESDDNIAETVMSNGEIISNSVSTTPSFKNGTKSRTIIQSPDTVIVRSMSMTNVTDTSQKNCKTRSIDKTKQN